MLVLLVIFMVTAASVNPGIVNLPTVGGAKTQALPPIFLSVDANENITVKREGEASQTLSRLELGAFARTQAEKSADQPVVLAADKSVKYEVVMDVMAKLKENGVKRVGLAVKSQ
jgi:biopolymer transport protein TolR